MPEDGPAPPPLGRLEQRVERLEVRWDRWDERLTGVEGRLHAEIHDNFLWILGILFGATVSVLLALATLMRPQTAKKPSVREGL
ncbi:MAG: hypothetical protein M0Z27_05575 [Thermaerobacter sp.]|jgi:predicted outer membrane lipoprotein|nr:hypothetical protein [Thermaerobacter sp.]